MSFRNFVINEFNWIKNFIIINSKNCDIKCRIPKSTRFSHHGIGIILARKVKLGENCLLRQNVTMGQRHGVCEIKVGDNVIFGAGSCVLGKVRIGNNVKIGANSVILKDVPSNFVVTGIWK
jgi:serine O-acetyltransferase